MISREGGSEIAGDTRARAPTPQAHTALAASRPPLSRIHSSAFREKVASLEKKSNSIRFFSHREINSYLTVPTCSVQKSTRRWPTTR